MKFVKGDAIAAIVITIVNILGGLTSLILPLLIFFVGLTIGSIVISMVIPIFKMSEVIGR